MKARMDVPAFKYLVHFTELLAVVFVIYVLIRYIGFLFLQQVNVENGKTVFKDPE